MTDREAMQMALDALETVTAKMLDCRDELAEYGGRPKSTGHKQRLWDSSHDVYVDNAIPAAEALRARLAQGEQGEQEPVKHWSDCAIHNAPAYPQGKCDCGGFPIAWFDPKGIHLEFDIEDCFSLQEKEGYQPLYTAPPQRE